uniref:Uncharacterized protein n=1 Tax=Anguilla anguilla TaxID=7936 RepID=A0A0E9U8M2_ANGAN
MLPRSSAYIYYIFKILNSTKYKNT